MTLQPAAPRSFPILRALSNVAALLLLLAAVDGGLSWLRGTPTYSCAVLQMAVANSVMEAIGMFGLLVAIAGAAVGGARHWLTGWGVAIMVFGLIGTVMAAEPVARLCGPS